MTVRSNPSRNPSRNPSQSITPVTDKPAEMMEKVESVTNPSRSVCDGFGEVKAMKYIEKHTLSPSLYESVTYPPRAVYVRVRVYARVV